MQEQFENVKIEGMTNEKMNQAIEIAMKAYNPNQVSGATAQIHALFPDMSKAQLAQVRSIVDYNRAYDQNGALMEQMERALGCGDKDNMDYKAVDKLLNRRAEILAQSKGMARPISQNASDCPKGSKMLHVIGRTPEPEMPEIEPVVIEEEPISVPEYTPIITDNTPIQPVMLRKMAVQVEEPAMGREYLAKNVSDHWNNAEVQKSIPDEEAEKIIRFHERLAGKSK